MCVANFVIIAMLFLFPGLLLFCSSSHATDTNVMGPTDLETLFKYLIEREKVLLLDMLGIPSEKLPVNFTVPQYMKDLYTLVSSMNFTANATVTQSGAEKDVDKSLNAGTVYSLINRDNRQELTHVKQHLRFHTPFIVSEGDVSSAQLRLFRQAPLDGSGEVIARAMVYLVLEVSDLSGGDKLQLLDKVDLFDIGGDQWVVFDIKAAAREWVKCPRGTFELELHTELVNNTKVTPSSLGLKKPSSNTPKETIAVVFLKNGDKMDIDIVSRLRRSQDVLARVIGNNLPDWWRNTRKDLKRRDNVCQKREFYVDFGLLGWKSIVSPRGFWSSVCSGECPLTLSNNMNASNHARIQNIMHHKHPADFPSVACVPVKLSYFIVLYRNRNGDLVLRRMNDMIAVHCGCQ